MQLTANQQALSLESIFLEKSYSQTPEDFIPELSSLEPPILEIQISVLSPEVITLDDSGPGNKEAIVFRHNVELKLIAEGEGGSQDTVLAELNGVYRLIYSLVNELPTEPEIAIFAQQVVPLDFWPFWREHVQSTVVKMGFPLLTLPPFAQSAGASEAGEKGLR